MNLHQHWFLAIPIAAALLHGGFARADEGDEALGWLNNDVLKPFDKSINELTDKVMFTIRETTDEIMKSIERRSGRFQSRVKLVHDYVRAKFDESHDLVRSGEFRAFPPEEERYEEPRSWKVDRTVDLVSDAIEMGATSDELRGGLEDIENDDLFGVTGSAPMRDMLETVRDTARERMREQAEQEAYVIDTQIAEVDYQLDSAREKRSRASGKMNKSIPQWGVEPYVCPNLTTWDDCTHYHIKSAFLRYRSLISSSIDRAERDYDRYNAEVNRLQDRKSQLQTEQSAVRSRIGDDPSQQGLTDPGGTQHRFFYDESR